MGKYTELPGLESIEFRRDGNNSMDFLPPALFVVAVIAVVAPVTLLLLMIWDRALPGYGPAAMMMVACLIAGVGLIRFYRTSPMFDHYWRTSSDGLTVARLFKRRFIQWHEVDSAQTRCVNVLVGGVHVLQTSKGAIYVPIGPMYLGASIKQHLRRLGKGEGIELYDRGDTLWNPISDDIPRRMDWVNPKPPKTSLVVGVFVTAQLLLIPAVRLVSLDQRIWWICASLAFLVCATLNLQGLKLAHTAKSVRLDDDHLEAKMVLGSISLPWDRIRSTAMEDRCVKIVGPRWRTVFIPWTADDDDSRRLGLAIIRRLREEPRPVQLPLPETEAPDESPSD